MNQISSGITAFNKLLGYAAAWLCLGLVLLQVVIVLNRYCFGYSGIFGFAMVNYEEALLYIFSAIFLLGSAYTYSENGHVRLDILFGEFKPSTQKTIDIIGNLLLLLPFMLLLIVKSNRNLTLSWDIAERSTDGGIPYMYLWLSMVPFFAISLGLQAVANVVRLSQEVFSPTRLLHIGLAIFLILVFGTIFVFSIQWADTANWTQVEPACVDLAKRLGLTTSYISTEGSK